MNYESTVTVHSEVMAGVLFVVRKPSYGRRIDFEQQTSGFRKEAQERAKKFHKRNAEKEEQDAEFYAAARNRVLDLQGKLSTATDEEKPALQQQIDNIEAEVAPINDELLSELVQLGDEARSAAMLQYNPLRIRWGLQEVLGHEIDGQPATVDTLIAAGSYELTMEVLAAIDAVSGMSTEQLKNLPSPTTFSVLVPATSPSTTVNAASTPESTVSETAA